VPFAPLRAVFYTATGGAIVAGTATLIGHGPPPVVTGASLAAYLGLVALAVTEPRSRIFGDVVARVPAGIALTFDDGPHPVFTRKVMDALEARNARGTFFMIGRKMRAHPDVVREVIARGHAVGAHGFSHDRLYAMRSFGWLEKDADEEERVWEEVVGRLPVLYRPPIGLVNPRIVRLAAERDRKIIAWTIRPRDGLARTPARTVAERVTTRLHAGDIVLLHDTAEDDTREPAALAALPTILDAAARLGLTPGTVSVPVPELPPP
jgi:peptidoglycan/xylan/chitin deacetylase (PgdA/CDA1 family)